MRTTNLFVARLCLRKKFRFLKAREVAKRTPHAEHGLSRLPHDSQGLLPFSKWSRISDPEWQRECEEPSGRFLYLLRGLPGVLSHVVSVPWYHRPRASPLWAFDQPAKHSSLAALARRIDLELRARNGS